MDIKHTLHVTYTTIGSVSAWMKNAKPLTSLLLASIIQESNWQKLLDRVEAVLDELPPAWGTNWQAAGKVKWRRKTDRAIRQSLR